MRSRNGGVIADPLFVGATRPPMRWGVTYAALLGNLAERGLDFADSAIVFAGVTVEVEDARRDYGETRVICYGHLAGRMVVVGYVQRGSTRHIFSMRKANDREKERLAPYFEI